MNGEVPRARPGTAVRRGWTGGDEQFRAVVSSALDGIVCTDSAERIVFANAAAERLFGCTEGELVGCRFTALVQAPERDLHISQLASRATRSGQIVGPARHYADARRTDGTEFPIEFTVSSWTSGGERMFSCIFRDRTAQRRLEALERKVVRRDLLVARAVQAIAKAPNLAAAFRAFCDVVNADTPFERAGLIVPIGKGFTRWSPP